MRRVMQVVCEYFGKIFSYLPCYWKNFLILPLSNIRGSDRQDMGFDNQ